MKKPSRLSYAYAVGWVRALEKGLIEQAVFKEASEEKDLARVLKVIFDAGDFTDELIQIKDTDELDEYIHKEEEAIKSLMGKILLEEDLLKIFEIEDDPDNAMSVVEKSGYSFILDYVRHKIDLSNLKILLRAKYRGLSRDKFESLVLKKGFLDQKWLLECFDLSFGEIGEKMKFSPYKNIWAGAVDSMEERETFLELERGIEDFLMGFLKKAKYIVFGPEPVLAYGLAKKRELRLVRLLGIGKVNQIPVDLLKERISETYV